MVPMRMELDVHPLTLKFRGDQAPLEPGYRRRMFDIYGRQTRFVFFVGVMLIASFGLMDVYSEAPDLRRTWTIRYAFDVPTWLFILALSFSPWFEKIRQHLVFLWVVTGGLFCIWLSFYASELFELYYLVSAALIFLGGYMFLGTEFLVATWAGWAVLALYPICSWVLGHEFDFAFQANFALIMGLNVGGMLAAYVAELRTRREYLVETLLLEERRKVEEANRHLEQRVAERTDELEGANQKLLKEVRQRVEAQDQLDGFQRYLTDFFDSSPALIFLLDEQARVTRWNRSATLALGKALQGKEGQPLLTVLPELALHSDLVNRALRHGEPQKSQRLQFERRRFNVTADFTVFPLRHGGAVIHLEDATHRVQMDEMMVQSEKLTSLAGLATGMAHEINNPLGGMLQGLQNVRRRLSPKLKANLEPAERFGVDLETLQSYLEARQIPEFFDSMQEAGERAAELVKKMLQFSRLDEGSAEEFDVNEAIQAALVLGSSDFDLKQRYDIKGMDFSLNLKKLPPYLGRRSQFEQAMLSLIKNAVQAVEGQERREVKIATEVEQGQSISVIVSDNGPGMTEKVRRRALEPFFTTRSPGEGAGLGLALAQFVIMEIHGGVLSINSSPGKGCEARIRLPFRVRTERGK